MRGVLVQTSAKVNLCLRVLGRRSDGFHEVETVLHTVDLWDRVYLYPVPEAGGITLEVNSGEAPADESNLCWRAASVLAKRTNTKLGAAIRLEKSIPAGAGLGGGSSDAAATLVGLARIWELDLQSAALGELGAELGADVPFFLKGGCCLARGKGERLEVCSGVSACLVVVVPEHRVPTAQAYAALGRGVSRGRRRGMTRAVQRLLRAVQQSDLAALGKALHNDFEAAGMAGIVKGLEAKDDLIEAGCLGASLSGSGSAVFGVAPDRETAGQVAEQLRDRWSWVRVASTVPAGRNLLVSDAEG